MRALLIVVIVAAIAAAALWYGAPALGYRLPDGAFLQLFYLSLIALAWAAFATRRDGSREGFGRLLFYLLIWLGVIGAVMLAISVFSG